ncbi:MAG: hypothetical protein VKI82_14935, partial [Leptolyngbya sp.]|nr:hypothetical protein [Leptolyngbya sp.]
MNFWVNFIALLPGTILTILIILIAFLRFYDQTDFTLLGYLANPRDWSNRCTVAAIVVAMVGFGIEWNRRNQETDRLVAEEYRRIEEEQRRTEEEQRRAKQEQRRIEEEQRRIKREEQATRRARIEAERDLALLNHLIDPSDRNRAILTQVRDLIQE